MKTLLIAILLLTIPINLNAKRTDMYQHTRNKRIHSQKLQHIINISPRLLFIIKSAKNGNAMAQFDLAMIYARGDGVRKNEKIAFEWFHKAALNNHTEAKYYMGLSFLQGRGVKRQPHLARIWFKRANNDGHPKAMYHLSRLDKSLLKHRN